MSSANTNLHSFSSNSMKLNTITTEDNINDDSNVLGLQWNPTTV